LALKVVPGSFDKWLLMGSSGRKKIATLTECGEVWRLAGEGASVRAIAAEVFGDRRFRGRVERILAAPVSTAGLTGELDVPTDEVFAAQTVPVVRLALGRYLARVERGEVQPSLAEMVKLLDLERRLQVIDSIELMNALTRAPNDPAEPAA
jgi:hypothetical protein